MRMTMLEMSRKEKELFISGLGEDDFREKIVRRLFKSLGYSDGRDTCGPEEYGKDAIFSEKDRFGVQNFTAVQTKVGNVNLSSDASKNIHNILAQLRTALNQAHVCTLSKQKVLPQIVYLVASGKINQAARGHIADNIPDPRLRFLDRDDLISKIDEQCPELWAGVVADVSPYLKALAHRVEELSITADSNPVHSSLGAFAAASDVRFVDLKLGYQETKIVKRSGAISEEFEYKEISGTALLGGSSVRALLLGDAGTGKSTLLVRMAYMVAKQSISSVKNYRVPVLARAHELVGRTAESHYAVLESIVAKMHELTAPPFVEEDFREGRIVLLVDGLDELAESNDRQDVIDFLLIFSEIYPSCSIAITSRPYGSLERLTGLDRFKRYRISELSMDEASKMLKGMSVAGDKHDSAWRKEILRRINGVHGIELNPLLVTVFAVSSGIEKRDIPANITELFSKFTELMLGRWDEKKGLNLQYQSKVKEHLLAAFAFQLQNRGETRFSREEFISFAEKKLSEMNLLADCDVLLSETLDRSGLIRGDDSEMEFKHHLLQEFFAAKGIPDLSFVKRAVRNEWWRNSIVFYFGNTPESAAVLLDLVTDPDADAAMSFQTVGLALQACYLSKLDERVEVWKWVVDTAAISARDKLNVDGLKYPITTFIGSYLESRDSFALGGIEKVEFDINSWCSDAGVEQESRELRTFWYAAALIELGQFTVLADILKSYQFANSLLATAIHFGCFFSASARHISDAAKRSAEAICLQLDPQVDTLRSKIAAEFKGQLLEYRNGGVVALDADEGAQLAPDSQAR
uniref:NACHT family n=1 Tax=Mycena chlorophos TaxID=658473 RepID=A0ABQ0L175_MYCCL|nr:NACHT family [Mycena chlorophos]